MAKPKVYTREEKIEVAITYLVEGTVKATARKTGVPRSTIRDWTTQDWWSEVVGEARDRFDDELDNAYTNIMNKGLEKVSERLEAGDPVKNKDGSVGYMPVKAKDCAWTAAVMADKRALLRGKPTKISKDNSVSDNLKEFQKALEAVGKQKESQMIGEAAKEIEEDEIIRH